LSLGIGFVIDSNFIANPKLHKLHKWHKKLSAFNQVTDAFEDFDKSPNSKFNQATRFITFAIIALDDILDDAANGCEEGSLALQSEISILLDQNLKKLEFSLGEQTVIKNKFEEIVADILLDTSINAGISANETIEDMRVGGYPSTLVGIAICIAILQDKDADFLENESFKTLITKITQLARICDDIVSEVDLRNLVWYITNLERSFKSGVDPRNLAKIIAGFEGDIKSLILDSKLDFTAAEKAFVSRVAFFYLDYLKSWLGRSEDENLKVFYADLNKI